MSSSLTGAWRGTATTPNQGSFPILLTFLADGAMFASESPGQFESTGHGNWESHGDEIAFTFISLFGRQEGGNNGHLKVVARMNHDDAESQWHGSFKIEVFDHAGQVSMTDRGIFSLTRIVIETVD